MSRHFLIQSVKHLSYLLILLLLFLSVLTFSPNTPYSNSLGYLGHICGFSLRFLLGFLTYPLLVHTASKEWEKLRACLRNQTYTCTRPSFYPYIYALATFSSGILLTHLANYFPQPLSVLLPYSLAGQNMANFIVAGMPIAALYELLPFPNLHAFFGATGLPIVFGFTLLTSLWALSLHKETSGFALKSLLPSWLKKSRHPAPYHNDDQESFSTHLEPVHATSFSAKDTLSSSDTPTSHHCPGHSRTDPSSVATSERAAQTQNLSNTALEKQNFVATALPGPGFDKKRRPIVLPGKRILTPATIVDNKKIKDDIKALARLLEETLLSFGIEARVGNIHIGPRVLSFEVHPPVGVKVQRIKALENDIALNLQAKSIRIIAPIPGKAAVGIEIPSPLSQEVNFKQMVSSYQSSGKEHAIPVILGKTVNGEDITFDLAKMPHMIIAGATGSGKSVCVNTIIMSIIMHATPDQIKLLMIDPKKVELTPYTKLPHMIAPVITEPQHAVDSLKWLVKEMEKRYEVLKTLGFRHIQAFNSRTINAASEANQKIPIPEKLPYIVGIVDELADLMMTSPGDIETPIARIAQMARAVGIHLILATQRPSREVITGLIKANFPARIAFKVASKINSQIILDETGAESLLGNGDMLFLHPAKGVTCRAQGVFVSDNDIEKVLTHLQLQQAPNYWFDPEQIQDDFSDIDSDGEEDELYSQARQMVIETQTASTTFLQRKLRVGYARAASLMDALYERGVVSASEGGKARKVLVNFDDSA